MVLLPQLAGPTVSKRISTSLSPENNPQVSAQLKKGQLSRSEVNTISAATARFGRCSTKAATDRP